MENILKDFIHIMFHQCKNPCYQIKTLTSYYLKQFLRKRLWIHYVLKTSLTNSIKEYPDSKYREELMYYLLKAKYLLGENSIDEKKRERLNSALDEYFTFTDEFPTSKYRKEADRYFASTKKLMNLSDDEINKTQK